MTTQSFAAPQTGAGPDALSPAEARIADLWQILLGPGVGAPDRDSDFYQLGGTPDLAAQLAARVAAEFGEELSPESLTGPLTVAGLADLLAEQAFSRAQMLFAFGDEDEQDDESSALDISADAPGGSWAAEEAAIRPVPRDGALLPPSFAQHSLWFLDQLDPGRAEYLIPIGLRLTGPLDVGALQAALDGLVARHESLRTRFAADQDGHPRQHIDPPAPLALAVHDLSAAKGDRDSRESAALRFLDDEAFRPMDLATGPLLRAVLARLTDTDHLLAITVHHIVFDGWSTGIFQRELTALYQAAVTAGPNPLPPLPVQYADFSVWQQERLTGQLLEDRLGYWREQLAGGEPLELPTGRSRPARRTGQGATAGFTLSAALVGRARALAERSGASLFMVLLAAFQTVLSKYSGQDDIAVGTPAAGRTRPEIEGLVGFFLNTLVMRTDLSEDPTFEELVGRVMDTALGAYDHQDIPFERILEELAPGRNAARNPLFQTMLILQNLPETGGWDLAGLHVEPFEFEARQAKFDVTCYLTEAPGGALDGMIVYCTDLFDPPTMQRLAGHFETLLDAATTRPAARLSELELLTPAERRRLLVEWNGADAPQGSRPDGPATVHEAVADWAVRTPDADALVWGSGALSYRGFNEEANRLAHHLRALGVGPGTTVGVCLERGPALITALFGILKAGGDYLPLDFGFPVERIAYMVEDSGARLAVTQSSLLGRMPADVSCVLLDGERDRALISTQAATDPEPLAGPADLVYTSYTSGSSGRPKGVQVEHGALRARIRDTVRDLGLGPGERMLQFSSVNFEGAVGQIYASLTSGSALVLREEGWDPDGIISLLRSKRVTVAWLTPSAFGVLGGQLTGPQPLGPDLRLVRLGGEALQLEQIRQWFERCDIPLLNGYGPTEGAMEAISGRIEAVPGYVPIGRPVGRTKVYVVDRHDHPVPVGVPGEILIAGEVLARGYVNRPELTADRFAVLDLDGTARRVYRTGDRARWHEDGRLEFLGRIDKQVKLRGFRIELGEIESVLLAHESVGSAAVILREDAPGGKRLAAYVVPADPAAGVTVRDLRAHLALSVPEYMVPAAFVVLDELPLTRSGKADHQALPEPDYQDEQRAAGYLAPRTATERAVVEIWSEILGVSPIGVHDDFFALGGHSLLATQVVSRLRTRLGVEVPVRTIFAALTPAELAEAVQLSDGATGPGAAPLVPVPRDGSPLPLSFAQQRLWFLDQLEPGRAEYLIPIALRAAGRPDLPALETALAGLVARHEVLRTRFVTDAEGEPGQVVDPAGPVAVTVYDLSDIAYADPGQREAAGLRLMQEEIQRPMDLAVGPLRVVLIRLAEEDSILTITVHHVASDAWSAGVLSRELTALYAAAVTGAADPLPALPIQYADFAAWQREWLSGEVYGQQVGYWRERLAGIEALELPTDRKRPAERSGKGDAVRFTVSAEVAERARAVAGGNGASLFMVLFAAFQLLLSKYSGQQDIAVGTPIAGRTRAEVEGLVGFFVNTLVMRTDLSQDPTFLELLGRVKETALGAYDHQDLPFERLVEELAPERDLARNPLFQTMFSLQNVPDSDSWQMPGLAVDRLDLDTQESKFDLALYLAEAPDGTLNGGVVYSTDLYDADTMERFVEYYDNLLAAATTDPATRLSGLDPLSPAERRRVLVDWNATAVDYPDTATLHSLFEKRAAAEPDAVAVVCEDRTLTFGELNEQANRLARHLRSLGVRPDLPVGVCLDRSPELVVALLGILKAGGAYVPLDPEYPADRLDYLVGDSAAAFIVTHSAHADRLPGDVPRFLVDLDAAQVAPLPATDLEPLAGPDDLCYLIYTSGSTGRPKGVRIEHGGVVNYLAGMQHEFPLAPGEAFLQATPLSFDVSAYEIFWPLWQGAKVVLVPASDRLDMARVSELMREHRIVGLHFVPSLLDLFVEGVRPEDCAHLRTAFASGEPLQPTLVARFLDRLPGDLVNLYGATEVSVDTTFWRARREAPHGPVLAGRPMINQSVYVLDRAGNPVPPGVLGEVYLGGLSVGRGYHERPELSAERFLPDPFLPGAFSARPGARMYRTGDLGRFTRDGQLDLLGRVDRQVKLRGVRIELGEIEAALLAAGGVGACAAILREDTPGDKRLVAYCVPAPGGGADPGADADVDPARLRAWCTDTLPRAMVPSAIILLDALPLSPNGKVDHKALPAPDAADDEPDAGYAAPLDAIEMAVAQIMAEVLGVDKVGRYDGFFDRGGHSLLATRLVNRLEAATGVRVSLRGLFLTPTVLGIKDLLLEGLAAQGDES
ncbi:MAG TPA: amino acid adenylation domain-containing protein [Actinocrinis sp.]|nr:amino acid adenylation domain-containing protein [Actinocrinis sp.]